VLLVDKPEGPTSHDVVAAARRALGMPRVGHTGTLDPFASGLLLLVVGPATRLSTFLTGMDKSYRAEVRLGVTTDTLDREGVVVAESEGWESLDEAALESALERLRGPLLQRPPAYSAKKVAGEAAHRKARRGEPVRLEPVRVTVHELRLDRLDPPRVELAVRCSSGTYVRALARDLGEALGVGGHLTALRRTAVGPFRVEDAVPPEALADELASGALRTPEAALEAAGVALVEVEPAAVERLARGQTVDAPAAAGSTGARVVAAVDAMGLVAIVELVEGTLQPRKVFRGAEGSA
jgi:tRNA pseudouridine55 synthase